VAVVQAVRLLLALQSILDRILHLRMTFVHGTGLMISIVFSLEIWIYDKLVSPNVPACIRCGIKKLSSSRFSYMIDRDRLPMREISAEAGSFTCHVGQTKRALLEWR
jgi:hypothetical protein